MKIIVEKRKINTVLFILAIVLFIIVSINFYGSKMNTFDLDGLTVELYPLSTPIKIGDLTTFQVLIYNGEKLLEEDLNVHITVEPKKNIADTMERKLIHVEDILYETTLQLFQGGNWEAVVSIRKGGSFFEKKFDLFVES